ncbi:hypothetical protein GEV33_002569 [Tenebrio molitor]|uniref:Uncharacterized protein n=1 Tax=Tenebrio molitor TaxID=7067 RepID=A0A8J6LIP0_TENMO|nr:hypothetical protein GEV33_002569 [Tenebrio molitor]
MSWRARSLQDLRDAGGTFESSSQRGWNVEVIASLLEKRQRCIPDRFFDSEIIKEECAGCLHAGANSLKGWKTRRYFVRSRSALTTLDFIAKRRTVGGGGGDHESSYRGKCLFWQSGLVQEECSLRENQQFLPDSCAQSISEETLEEKLEKQFSKRPRASKPTVSKFVLTPHINAVAHADDSPIWASMLYVCDIKIHLH